MTDSDRPYIVVSSDTHAGAQMLDYKPYLPIQWHEKFDAWAANFSDGWADVDEPGDNRMGVSSYLSAVNWESDRRISDLEGEGVAAEVVYPNTVPPFFPAGVITAAGPRNQEEYDSRWEGIKAHNRWLIDFCALAPGRRAGLAQMLATDVANAIGEAMYAKENGLSGILLPANHFELLNNWFLPKYDPLWQALEELELPIHCHSAIPSNASSVENGPASPALGLFEGSGFSKRPLAHFILAGVFDRFPNLKLVMTESMTAWIPPTLNALDAFCKAALVPGSITNKFGAEAVSKLSRKPSEYFASNCYAASYLTGADIATIDEVGSDNIMWGSDYPHHEGTWPYTHEAYRSNFAGLSEDVTRKILGTTAVEIYHLDAGLLQGVADRIGPRPSEVSVPLEDAQWPTDSLCPTFLDRADMEAIYTAKR